MKRSATIAGMVLALVAVGAVAAAADTVASTDDEKPMTQVQERIQLQTEECVAEEAVQIRTQQRLQTAAEPAPHGRDDAPRLQLQEQEQNQHQVKAQNCDGCDPVEEPVQEREQNRLRVNEPETPGNGDATPERARHEIAAHKGGNG